MRRLIDQYAAAFVFPRAAPGIALIIRLIAPPEHRGDAERRFAEATIFERVMNALAGRIKSSLRYGADNRLVGSGCSQHRIAVSQRRRERFFDYRVSARLRCGDGRCGVLRMWST